LQDDVYVGAIEKLNHYYDQISSMIGIALILDPKRKVQYLRNTLQWEDDWVETILGYFHTNYYRQRVPNEETSNSIPTAIGGFGEFEKKQRVEVNNAREVSEEYDRYLNAPLAVVGVFLESQSI
jgi:hypothetical protein